ncbi:PAS fold-containing protein [Halogranum gelatinilyticum]|uniref:PAS fold-containing protein n=1 Tax=Halogranum gelatinilyticum TaxID=660521 RepID=A0A1G9VR14_9EURY|nr:PAS domain-containing protein [Halogranum gelatinilyticum]SDM74411.1 PAS fold-containing protein [Halogranum gelatinilyticum]
MGTSDANRGGRTFAQAALHLFPAEIAVLDRDGVIVSTNLAWRMFGEANGLTEGADMVGVNYLDVCDAAASDDPVSATAAAGIRDVFDGIRDEFRLEYPCHSPDEKRWFVMRVIPFSVGEATYALVAHMDVTDRKLAELDVQTRTDQFEAIATLLSEDLQDTLSTAISRVIVLSSEVDSEETVRLEASLQRMSALLTDALALLRGETLDVTDVSLEATTLAAWGRTDTLDATLDVEESGVLEADLSLFGQLFQHLFQSALIQGGTKVDIRVGVANDAIYFEYHRSSVPQAVVEGGARSGSSAIDPDVAVAARIAEVHGWEFSTVAEDGTMRYEISGIQWRG